MQLSSKISSNHFPGRFTALQFIIKYVTNGLVQNHISYLTAPISYIMPTYVNLANSIHNSHIKVLAYKQILKEKETILFLHWKLRYFCTVLK